MKDNNDDQGREKECEACDVLGDYMCSGRPDDRPGQTQNKMKKGQVK